MRSDKLKQWIAAHNSAESIAADIFSLTPELWEELLKEALIHSDIAEVFFSADNVLPEPARERAALEAYCKKPEIFGTVVMQLKGWNSGNTPSSNVIDTSALFRVFTPALAENRPVLHREVIPSRSNVNIRYSGEVLFQADWDVLHRLINLSGGKFNELIHVSMNDLIDGLNLTRCGDTYAAVKASLVRLAESSLFIEVFSESGKAKIRIGEDPSAPATPRKTRRRREISTILHMIERYYLAGEGGLTYSLDSRLMLLFGNSEYGLVDWGIRQNISRNELAKKLQCLFSGQKANRQFHKVQKLHTLSGLSSSPKEFIRILTTALDELMRAKVIDAYWVNKMERGHPEKRLICIWKCVTDSPNEGIPTEPGQYYNAPKSAKRTYAPKAARKPRAASRKAAVFTNAVTGDLFSSVETPDGDSAPTEK